MVLNSNAHTVRTKEPIFPVSLGHLLVGFTTGHWPSRTLEKSENASKTLRFRDALVWTEGLNGGKSSVFKGLQILRAFVDGA